MNLSPSSQSEFLINYAANRAKKVATHARDCQESVTEKSSRLVQWIFVNPHFTEPRSVPNLGVRGPY